MMLLQNPTLDSVRDDGSMGVLRLTQNGFLTVITSSLIKNCAEQTADPQIVGSSPAICLRVISPNVPHEGQESTAQ